jgi:CRP-like cAMP-binding protein
VSTHKVPRRSPPRPLKPAARPIPSKGEPFSALRQRTTTVRARRGQQLSFMAGPAEIVYIVRSGLLVLQTMPSGKHRQLLALLYPHDVVRAAFTPPLPTAALSAVAPAELWRLPASTFETLLGADALLAQQFIRQLADQHARALLHVAMIGGLNGEERVASFLIELGLRIGQPSGSGISFEVPLSRTDVADYLALNADTLSRIMSRLKARGLVAQTGRGRAVVPDWEALCRQSPIANALRALHGRPTSEGG